jgi:hypothetical protein
MFDSKKTNDLRKLLFKGNEQERMISAGVLRTIFADITRLYFENKQARGKGILIFNSDDPEKSKYITKEELQDDLALAEEDCLDDFAEGFKKMIAVIDKEAESDLALVAMLYPDGIAVNIINPDEINEKIDELSNGIMY